MPLSAGIRLGPYEILAPIGAGGMGEVYRARDARLGRDVALKVLPDVFAKDAERMARFEREAQVLASLNHPNIAALYGLEESNDTRALVMELVEGLTLAERIETQDHSPSGAPPAVAFGSSRTASAIPIDEALPIARQIAGALEYAHDKGVIHRDLKPANIKLTHDGKVKILDFGLAKALDDDPVSGSVTNSPTLSIAATRAGVILGTAGYMSPEQARGKPADRRSDIWSFGVVLYEMLTGRRLYSGESVADTLASVLKEKPALENLPTGVPRAIRNLLGRCLERDASRRLQAMGEARITIDDEINSPGGDREAAVSESLRPAVSAPPGRPVSWMAATTGCLLAALGLGLVHFRETPPSQERNVRFELAAPEKNPVGTFHISPDGRYLVMAAALGRRGPLFLRPLDSLEARSLAGTDGATYPFWSPDSAFIGFFAGGKLKKVAVSGGPPQTLCDAAEGRGGTWNREGVVIFSPGPTSPLYRVAAAGGVPVAVTKLEGASSEGGHRFPELLPDGRHFLYHVLGEPEKHGIYAGSLDGAPPVRILPDDSSAAYAPAAAPGLNGHILFRRENTLMAQPFDAEHLKLTGEVFPVAERVGISANVSYGAFSVSENGVLVFGAGGFLVDQQLAWVDRAGKRLGVIGKPGRLGGESLSPNGKRVGFALVHPSGSGTDIWLYDLDRDTATRFTFGPGISVAPLWSPDGSRIVYASSPTTLARFDIYQKPSSGAGKEELLLRGGTNLRIWDWSRDGKWVVYTPESNAKTKADLWLLPMEGDHKPVPYLETPFDETLAQFSPDGRWMAYTSDESGQEQVYVQPIPASGAKWQASTTGGSRPRWSHDGRELFYASADQKLMAVPVKIAGTSSGDFQAGAPQPLFDFPATPGPFVFGYQPSADGRRFLVRAPAEGGTGPPPLTVVLHWEAGLKR